MEELFSAYYFIISRKLKIQHKCKKKKLCTVYGEGAVTDRTCQKWRAKFHAGDFSLDNVPLSGRSLKLIAIHSNIN